VTTLLGGPQTSWNFRISVLGLGENMSGENLEIVTSLAGRDGIRILVLKGRLTVETVACFQDAIRREDAPELIIDMSGVTSIDSAGLGAMIAAYILAKKASRKLSFAGMNERVKAVTDTSRLSQVLPIYATVKDAEAALSKHEDAL
jgi:anti-sigma B factor antagonist